MRKMIKLIIEHFYKKTPLFSCLDVVRYLKNRPDLVAINNHVHRKGDT